MYLIKFKQPTHFDARGRNGYMPCYGVMVHNMGDGDFSEVHLYPVGARGKESEACRIPILKEAIPDLIAALIDAIGHPLPPTT